MHIPDSLVERLLKSNKASNEQLTALREQAVAEHLSLQDLAIRNNLITEHDLTKLYATEIDVPFTDLKPEDINRDVLGELPEKIARQYRAVLFGAGENGVKLLAMDDPDDIQAINFLQKQLGSLKIHIAPATSIQTALDQYKSNPSGDLSKFLTTPENAGEEEEKEVSEEDLTEDSPIAQTANLLIEYAIKSGASDIHIEPQEDYVMVRYRIDGVLREANKLPKKVHSALVSRIKILSNLKIDERRVPQDGRFKIQVGSAVYALRVSTLPISDGEKVVMRILNESSDAVTLRGLGYWGPSYEAISHAITQPYGLILITGPTGSGKSTSLFSLLTILNQPAVNISTIEDPIEYKIRGVNQTQVNPKAGMTFANGLRALLRQDPNIIMVGEIRDSETSNLGVQAALTGHLVFATLHTNDAATCLPRLLDMNIEPFLIASTVRAVVGQRLVRKLCTNCRESYKPEEVELKQIEAMLTRSSSTNMKQIHEFEKIALADGMGKPEDGDKSDSNELSTSSTGLLRLWRAHDGGCERCKHVGYRGRSGIYEVLTSSTAMQTLIVSRATSDQLKSQGIKDGMVTMQLDGFIKALRGLTSIEELMRVTTES
ncbi:MAG TPA: GspE/PulE family protein [Candidatus Saccharimonadales bacterium]|nr:GspE/PulE family protein [Candidatus Saccharimonadales bacterium]